MNRRRRLDRILERLRVRHVAAGPSTGLPVDADEDQWLAAFEAMGNAGHFKRERDFPVALAEYRAALMAAHAQADPSLDPPAKFRPDAPLRQRQRLWRTLERFPAVWNGFAWLAEIVRRVAEGEPPVTEAEFAELGAWFRAHEDRLWEMCLPSELLDLGDGESESFGNIRWGIESGARGSRAGGTAERIRRFRANYSARLTGTQP